MKKRCPWVPDDNSIYAQYHDKEWGKQAHDDKTQFEFLILEGAQAGLSWATILQRREGYRKNFANYDPKKVARFTEKKIQKILLDPGVIRNKLKIRSAVKNAQVFIKIQKEFGSFSNYIWAFVDGKPIKNKARKLSDYAVFTPEAEAISKDLKKRGMSFVGPTIIYAHMQATGMVNDHTVDCFRYNQV